MVLVLIPQIAIPYHPHQYSNVYNPKRIDRRRFHIFFHITHRPESSLIMSVMRLVQSIKFVYVYYGRRHVFPVENGMLGWEQRLFFAI